MDESSYTLLETARRLGNQSSNVFFVGTVQEEVGLRGAMTSSYRINPDVSIGLDVTMSNDLPSSKPEDVVCYAGRGVGIRIMDGMILSERTLVDSFVSIADDLGIPYQREVLCRGGGDAAAMQKCRQGSHAITLSIPVRYLHSVNEMASKSDIAAAISLLEAFLKS